MNNEELNTLIFCSFRYALGRMTYIVSSVVKIILDNWNDIDSSTKELIYKEILQAIDENRYGNQCDLVEWNKILLKRS